MYVYFSPRHYNFSANVPVDRPSIISSPSLWGCIRVEFSHVPLDVSAGFPEGRPVSGRRLQLEVHCKSLRGRGLY